jgi:hypothetical protein
MRIWNCGYVHNLIDECAEMKGVEYEDCQDPVITTPDICG